MKNEPFTLTSFEFDTLRQYLAQNSGLELADNRRAQVALVISNCLKELGLNSAREYLDFLLNSPLRIKEQQKLIDKLTITETYFFRNKPHFDVLRGYILPEIIKRNKDKNLKIWSAGCASGEEPYTVAIILKEMEYYFRDWKIEILGSDVNTDMLQQAAEGVYNEHSIKMAEPYYLHKYFVKKDDHYYVKDIIKEMVTFRYFNLIKEPYPLSEMQNFNIIFCRNVTIYFKVSSTIRVIHNFFESLKWGGYLFIGYAESLYNINTEFNLIEKGDTFFYFKNPPEDIDPPPFLSKEETAELAAPLPLISSPSAETLLAEGRKLLAERNYEKAIFSFNQAIKEDPHLVEPYLYKGQIYAGRRHYQEALKEYQQALVLEPMNVEINFLLGLVYWEKGNIPEAVDCFKKAKYLNSDFCLSYYYLGLWWEKETQYEKALNEFSAVLLVLEKNPAQTENTLFAGFQLQELKQSCLEKIKYLKALIK